MRQCRDKIFLRVSVPLWPEICAIIAPNTEEFAMALHPLQSRRDAPAWEAWAATLGRPYCGRALSRRDFGRAAFAAVLAARPLLAGRPSLEPLSPGIKISLQIPADFTEEDLVFARQIGVEYVSIPTRGGTYETFARFKQRVEAAGLKVANIGNANVHNMPEVTLNLPGRDQKIAEYQQYLRDLARAGIFYTTYAHMGNGIWGSDREATRGGASARAFRLETAKGNWAGKVFQPPLSHGRKFTADELWENYTHFVRQVVPVAEELGI